MKESDLVELDKALREGEFLQALESEDDLGAVIRAHIHIEQHLILLLEALLRHPEHIINNLNFANRVRLAASLGGIKSEFIEPLIAIGNIRNKFAHKLNTELSAELVNNIYEKYSFTGKEAIQRGFNMINERRPPGKKYSSFETVEPRAKFDMLATSTRALLIMARFQVNELIASGQITI